MEGAVAVALSIAVGAGLAARADALVMGLADHTVHPALVRLASWAARWTRPDDLRRLALLLGADGVMTAVEGWVLQRGYRWGPWLVVGTTAALLPFEVVDLVQRPRAGLAVIFAIEPGHRRVPGRPGRARAPRAVPGPRVMRSVAGPIVYVSWRPSRPPVAYPGPCRRPRRPDFVPCYVDQLYPHVAEATVAVLRRAGCEVRFDERQTCCGQPMSNTGCVPDAARLARRHLDIFRGTTTSAPPPRCAEPGAPPLPRPRPAARRGRREDDGRDLRALRVPGQAPRRDRFSARASPTGRPARQLPRPARARPRQHERAARRRCGLARRAPARQGRRPRDCAPHPPRRVLRVRRHLRRRRGGPVGAHGAGPLRRLRERGGRVRHRHRHELPMHLDGVSRRSGGPRALHLAEILASS